MESRYYLHKKSNRLIRVSSVEGRSTYFMDYVSPPFHGKIIERASFEFLVKLGNFILVNETTAKILYDK